jgi:uncharacterized protein YbjT (DUF2867 family)
VFVSISLTFQEGHDIVIYLITGATGNVGSLVTERLIARGVRPRVFVRDAGKAKARYGENAVIRTGDLGDAASLSRALACVDVLFLVNSGHELAALDALAADTAKAAGVKRLVKLSSYDAREQNVGTGVWHAAGETAIRDRGVPFVFVQPSGFMSNALFIRHPFQEGVDAPGVVIYRGRRQLTGLGHLHDSLPHSASKLVLICKRPIGMARTP